MPERPPVFPPGQRVVFRPDHRSFGEFMLSEQMRDATAEVATDIANVTASKSARGEGPGPHMADQWAVNREAGIRKVGRNLRVQVTVFNPDIAAAAQEFGNGPRRGQRTRLLGRTAATFGDFRDHGEAKL